MKKMLLIALLSVPVEATAAEWFSEPSPTEIAMQGAFVGLATIDWMQTITFTQHDWKPGFTSYETNPLLGAYPSRARVNVAIPLAIVTHTLLVYALPRPWRNVVQAVGITGEMIAVGRNYGFGVTLTLPWN